jgi:hypothetical protein
LTPSSIDFRASSLNLISFATANISLREFVDDLLIGVVAAYSARPTLTRAGRNKRSPNL